MCHVIFLTTNNESVISYKTYVDNVEINTTLNEIKQAYERALKEYILEGNPDLFNTINMSTPAEALALTPAPTTNFNSVQGDVL